jgi:hypothetical protein
MVEMNALEQDNTGSKTPKEDTDKKIMKDFIGLLFGFGYVHWFGRATPFFPMARASAECWP